MSSLTKTISVAGVWASSVLPVVSAGKDVGSAVVASSGALAASTGIVVASSGALVASTGIVVASSGAIPLFSKVFTSSAGCRPSGSVMAGAADGAVCGSSSPVSSTPGDASSESGFSGSVCVGASAAGETSTASGWSSGGAVSKPSGSVIDSAGTGRRSAERRILGSSFSKTDTMHHL